MLTFDEKKVRKGRPLGLPYMGSKKKIARQIIQIIKDNFGVDKIVYDVFGGGGAITCECILQGLNVVYNDKNKDVSDMLQLAINSDREFLKTLIISREEFYVIKEKREKTPEDNLKLLVNSFGNDGKSYLYGKSFSDYKYELCKEIIFKHDVFSGYKQTETYKTAHRFYDEGKEEKNQVLQQSSRLQQLEQLQQLQQLQRLQRLQQLQQYIDVLNEDYTAFSNIEGAIFYLDPPYENTKKYDCDIEHSDFYDWCVEMSKKNIVLISSYKLTDDRFVCVHEFLKARSNMQSGYHNDNGKVERLFMVREQAEEYFK